LPEDGARIFHRRNAIRSSLQLVQDFIKDPFLQRRLARPYPRRHGFRCTWRCSGIVYERRK